MMKKQLVDRFNRRISFKTSGPKKNEFGDVVNSDAVVLVCWAEYWSQSIKDKVSSVGTVYEDVVYFNIPWMLRKKVNNSMKIAFDGEDYKIIGIDPRPSEELVRITAKVVS